MTFLGTVHQGVVVLPEGVCLPEGASVRVEPVEVEKAMEKEVGSIWDMSDLAVDTGIPGSAMPSRVFLGTNGWLAFINSADSLHLAATATWRGLQKRYDDVVITDHIVAETGNGLARGKARAQFLAAVRRLHELRRDEAAGDHGGVHNGSPFRTGRLLLSA